MDDLKSYVSILTKWNSSINLVSKSTVEDIWDRHIWDSRKCAFLRTVIRELKLNADVIQNRVEQVDPLNVDIISARALADLDILMSFSERHRKKDGICLFLKGQNHEVELTAARENWNMEVEVEPSLTSQRSCVLKIKEFSRVR